MTSNDLQRPKMTYDDLRRLHYDSILATFWLHSDYTLITFWLHSDYIQTVSSRFNDRLNSMIYDLKRSVDLRCLIDLVLHSSFDDLVSTFFACLFHIVEFAWRIKRRWWIPVDTCEPAPWWPACWCCKRSGTFSPKNLSAISPKNARKCVTFYPGDSAAPGWNKIGWTKVWSPFFLFQLNASCERIKWGQQGGPYQYCSI